MVLMLTHALHVDDITASEWFQANRTLGLFAVFTVSWLDFHTDHRDLAQVVLFHCTPPCCLSAARHPIHYTRSNADAHGDNRSHDKRETATEDLDLVSLTLPVTTHKDLVLLLDDRTHVSIVAFYTYVVIDDDEAIKCVE